MKWRHNRSSRRHSIRRLYVLAVTLPLLLILIPIVFFSLRNASQSSATWYDGNWAYRKRINIPSHTSLESNVYVSVPSFSATDATKFQTDCGDLRFTKESGQLLKYYVVDCDATANIHVLFDSLPAGESNYYMYYGNATAPNGFESADFGSAATGLGSLALATEEITPGPIAEWGMDEGYGTQTKDRTIRNLTGSITSAQWVNEERCVKDRCLSFDGSNDYVTVNDNAILDYGASSDFSLSVWAKLNTLSSDQTIVAKKSSQASGDAGFILNYNSASSTFSFRVSDGTDQFIITSNVFSAVEQWVHLAVIFDESSATDSTIYLDGVPSKASTTGTIGNVGSLANSQDLTIGTQGNGNSDLNGFVDELKIYSYSRSAAQVRSDYSGSGSIIGTKKNVSLASGLVGHWKLDEFPTSSTSVADSSGLSHTGTLTNMQESGTADASGGSTTVMVDSNGTLSSVDDSYVGMQLQISSTCGANTAGVFRPITDYVGSSKTFTVGEAFSATLNSCAYRIIHQNGAGRFGFSLQMDGVDDYVSVSNTSSLQLQQFTLSGWVKTTATGSLQGFITKDGNSASTRNYWLGMSDGTSGYGTAGSLVLIARAGGVNDSLKLGGTTLINDGSWHHIAATADGSTARIFIDGKLESATTYSGTFYTGTQEVYLGGGPSGGYPYAGLIDDPRIYNRAMSATEVASLASYAPGPIGYWKMDDASWTNNCSTTSVTDSSGNSYAGTACPNSTGPTTLANGKFDKAGVFDGVDDYVNVVGTNLGITNGSVSLSAWVNHTSNTGTYAIVGAVNGVTYGYGMVINNGALSLNVRNQTGTVNTTCDSSVLLIPAHTWTHIGATYEDSPTGTTVNAYINGVLVKTCSIAGRISGGTTVQIGARNSGSIPTSGKIDDVKIYDYKRTSAQMVEDMNGTHPLGGSPVASQTAYWPLDELQGTSVNSRGATSFTETLTGTLWKAKTDCTINGCLDFDGSDDVLTVTNADAIDFDVNLSTGFTISSWVYPDSDGENDVGQVFYKGTNTWCRVDSQSGSNLDLECSLDLTTSDATLNISTPLTTAAWTHVAVSYTDDADDEITIWVNGIPRGTSTNGSGSPAITDTANLLIGGTTTANFDGRLDEFKIYNAELSSTELQIDRNANASMNIGSSAASESTQGTDGAGNAPVVYLAFDDNTGTTAVDTSSSGNNGTLSGSGATWAPGKLGSAVQLNGSTSYVALSNNLVDAHTVGTICSWLYYDNPTDDGLAHSIFSDADLGGTVVKHILYVSEEGTDVARLRVQIREDGTANDRYDYNTADNAIPRQTWTHVCFRQTGTGVGVEIFVNGVEQTVAATNAGAGNLDDWFDNGAASVESVTIGNIQDNSPDSFFPGLIDEFKLYDYARTDAQIAYDFNRGAAIGHWKLDECQGTTLNDSSGRGNAATLTVGGSGSQTAVGTCATASTAWGNGATGKYNGSLNFDGTDDYASIADNALFSPATSTQSFSVWFKTSTNYSGGVGYLFSNVGTTTSHRFTAYVNTNNRVVCEAGNANGSGTSSPVQTVNDGAWHQIICILYYSGSNHVVTSALDGKVSTGGGSFSGNAITTTGRSKTLGTLANSVGSNNFTGQIDNLLIFNYRLSAPQVRKLYNDGAAVRFAPSTGSP